MVAINSALAWKLVIAKETISKAAEALDKVAEAEQRLAEAQAAYAGALNLVGVTTDDEELCTDTEASEVHLRHEGAVLLSLVCHKEAVEASRMYGFDMKKAMEYGFRNWAQSDEGRRFIRHVSRKLKSQRQ